MTTITREQFEKAYNHGGNGLYPLNKFFKFSHNADTETTVDHELDTITAELLKKDWESITIAEITEHFMSNNFKGSDVMWADGVEYDLDGGFVGRAEKEVKYDDTDTVETYVKDFIEELLDIVRHNKEAV